jgi:DNA-binding PadR family transcriptional regulator
MSFRFRSREARPAANERPRSRSAQAARDPDPFLPLTPAAFHVLLALADGAKHGYLILKDVEERTGGEVRLSTGTLYGLIKRFLDDELIVELPPAAEDDERRRPYKLTALGRDVASREAARLERLVSSARAVRLLPSIRHS